MPEDPVAAALVPAIRGGDLDSLRRIVAEHPAVVTSRVHGARTPLHVAADWPGYFPNGPAVVTLLIAAGADPNTPAPDETPLHWAASTDDVEVAAALIDGGADIEAPGASIAGGPPLDNAVGYGCWHVARLLVARGAQVDRLWHAAALGLQARVAELLPRTSPEQLDEAFWQACSGGQRRTAEYLLARGADVDASPHYAGGRTPLGAAGALDTRRQQLVNWLQANGGAATRTAPARRG